MESPGSVEEKSTIPLSENSKHKLKAFFETKLNEVANRILEQEESKEHKKQIKVKLASSQKTGLPGLVQKLTHNLKYGDSLTDYESGNLVDLEGKRQLFQAILDATEQGIGAPAKIWLQDQIESTISYVSSATSGLIALAGEDDAMSRRLRSQSLDSAIQANSLLEHLDPVQSQNYSKRLTDLANKQQWPY
jgi:hypothetical protein